MIPQIRPTELLRWLEAARAQGAPLVLDVREPAELRLASVKANGFELQSIPMGAIAARLNELDPTQPLAVLCHHGMRSLQVAAFLQSRGFTDVVNIAGGIDAWSTDLDPSIPRY